MYHMTFEQGQYGGFALVRHEWDKLPIYREVYQGNRPLENVVVAVKMAVFQRFGIRDVKVMWPGGFSHV